MQVFGTTPSLSLDITRMAGVVNSRTDLDQSQFPSDVSPGAGAGIYDALIPMLQQWKQQYNFVGSFFTSTSVTIPIQPTKTPPTGPSNAPYYRAIIAMGSEIGNHSYTHLINPPTVDAMGNPVPTIVVNGDDRLHLGREHQHPLRHAAGQRFGAQLDVQLRVRAIEDDRAAEHRHHDCRRGRTRRQRHGGHAQQIQQYYQTVAGGLTGYV